MDVKPVSHTLICYPPLVHCHTSTFV